MLSSFGLSDPGNRKINEDACYFDHSMGLSIVCDGISGNKGGDIASAIAIDIVKELVHQQWSVVQASKEDPSSKEKRHNTAHVLEAAVVEASKNIFQRAQADTSLAGMSTTIDVLLFTGSHAVLAHVGSGRAFLFRDHSLHQITEDHTLYFEMKKKGSPIPQGVDPTSLAKKITRAVGHQEQVKVDILEVELMDEDKFFLCTDGVWASFPMDKMKSHLIRSAPQDCVQGIMQDLKRLHPKDNYTALVSQVHAPELTNSAIAMPEKNTSAKAKIELTAKVPIFQFLSYPELIKLMSISELFKVKAGKVLCKEGDPGSEMMIILSGKLQVGIQGKKIAELGEGQAVGEMSFIEGGARTATLTALLDTNLVAFSRSSLFELLRAEPELSVKLLWGLTSELNRRLKVTSSQLAGRADTPTNKPTLTAPAELPFVYSKEL